MIGPFHEAKSIRSFPYDYWDAVFDAEKTLRFQGRARQLEDILANRMKKKPCGPFAMLVDCPVCKAPAHKWCRRMKFGKAAHWQRYRRGLKFARRTGLTE